MNALKSHFHFHIGMRTLKTAVAVGVSMLIGYLIHSPYPPFMAIGAFGCMESSITASMQGAKNLAIGNLFAALLSMVFGVLFNGHFAFGCFIGVIIMIVLCNLLHMESNTINLACVVFCCTLVDSSSNGILWYGLLRLRDTLIGCGIALLVNMLIRPYSGAERTKQGIIRAKKAMIPLMEQRALRDRIPDLRELRRNINAMDKNIDIILDERLNFSLKKSQVAHLRGCQQLVWKMRDALIGICCIDSTPSPSADNLARLEALGLSRGERHESILSGICDEEDSVVFNYYIRMFLDANDYLDQLIDL